MNEYQDSFLCNVNFNICTHFVIHSLIAAIESLSVILADILLTRHIRVSLSHLQQKCSTFINFQNVNKLYFVCLFISLEKRRIRGTWLALYSGPDAFLRPLNLRDVLACLYVFYTIIECMQVSHYNYISQLDFS